MEIDITEIVEFENPADYSASVAELGPMAGNITWRAALMNAERLLRLPQEWREELVDWLRGFGAWSDKELEAYTDVELKALLLQFIAGDLREAGFDYYSEEPFDWREEPFDWREDLTGRLFVGDDGKIYYYVGV